MEKILKSIPAVSGLLIFLGFLNYTFYYDFFGIDISSYLTTGELLLSFLQLTIPILFLTAFFLLMLIIIITGELISPRKKRDDKEDNEEEHSKNKIVFINEHIKEFLNEIRSSNFKKISEYFHLLIGFISVILTLCSHVFMIGFPIFVYNQIAYPEPILLNKTLTLVLGIIWIVFLFANLDTLEERRDVDYKRVKIIFATVFFIATIYIANKDNAMEILQGESNISVKLYFDNDTIRTDSNFAYIGKTERFIFFRNLQYSANEIYNANNILKIEFKKQQVPTKYKKNTGK